MMQGWLFHEDFWNLTCIEAYLSGIANDSMVILDLDTESWPVWTYTHSFFGKVRETEPPVSSSSSASALSPAPTNLVLIS